MPSRRINERTVSLSLFDVVGQDGDQIGFIAHVGLAESAGSQVTGAIAVLDMGPPLHGGLPPTQRIKADAVGSAELADDEVQKIRTFVDRHGSEHRSLLNLSPLRLVDAAPHMYCIHPHAEPCREDDGRYVRMRFSCAGFVLEAYRAARISLLDDDALPVVDMAVIHAGYPRQAQLLARGRIRPDALGLAGDGPWPVLLCGYLLHALDRPAPVIRQAPYKPTLEDKSFPREPDQRDEGRA